MHIFKYITQKMVTSSPCESCKSFGHRCLEHSIGEDEEEEYEDSSTTHEDDKNGKINAEESRFYFTRHQSYIREQKPKVGEQRRSAMKGNNDDDFDDSTKSKSKEETYLYKYCSFYIRRPKTSFAISLFLQVCFLIVTATLYMTNYDVFPYYFANVPLDLDEDFTKLRTDAYNYVTEDPRVDLLPTTALPQPERSRKESPLELIYESKLLNENILTKHSLESIQELESQIYSNPLFQTVCQRNLRVNSCQPPMSLLRLFDGSFRHADPKLYDPKFERVSTIINLAQNLSDTRPLLSFALDRNSVITSEKVYSRYLRSAVFHGLPLKGYRNSEDQKAEQLEMLKQTIVKAFAALLSDRYDEGIGEVKVYYNNMNLFFDAVEKQVAHDLFLVGGSLIFIFGFIWFQTGSLWITGWAVFGIITNFFGANLVYRIALDFKFIGMFHVLAMFIILGIGADDIFVFFNTWKLMENKNFATLEEHLYETFRVAAGAMFVTSFTTAAAFFSSANSPLLGVSSFGVFSGVLVIVNYLSVCVYFPSVVVTFHYYWKDCTPMCRSEKNEQNLLTPPASPNDDDNGNENRRHEAPHNDMTRLFRRIVVWFETTYANQVILHKKTRLFIFVLFGVISITFLVFALRIEPQDEMIQVWPVGTNWHDVHYIKLRSFQEKGEGTDVIRVYTVWGLKLQDRSKCHFTDFRCKGQTVFDEEFDMNKPKCQEALLSFCQRLKSLSPEEAEKLRIRRSVATNELELQCFIDEMDRYFKSDDFHGKTKYRNNGNNVTFSIPMDRQKTMALMDTLPMVYNTSALTESYYRYFEVALGYWLSGGGNPDYNFYKYSSFLGGSIDKSRGGNPIQQQAQGGLYGNRLRYVAVVVNTSLTGTKLKYSEGVQVSKNWETFIENEMKEMPEGCNKAFQCTPEWFDWHWLNVQTELLKGAKHGIMIGLAVAFPVIVITTANWIVGIFAIFTIALITISVVGLIPMLGWQLGVLESLNLTIVVGLSVDYVVHLADGYVRCRDFSREDRTRYMLGHVGVSVLAGAATTLGASAFMLGSKILFFFQFGIFIFCTIGFSIIYALVVFTVLIGCFGPQGNSGDLTFIKDYLFKKPKKTNKEQSRGETLPFRMDDEEMASLTES